MFAVPRFFTLVGALLLLPCCGPLLTEAGSKVQVIPGHAIGGAPPPAGCELLGSVEWGGYRSGRANSDVMRSRAAALGATHIQILEQPASAESIVALAYRCRPAP